MGITFEPDVAVFHDTVGVDVAEELLNWIRTHPRGEIDLRRCTHIHAAQLQVLMAARSQVVAWPEDASLKSWLTTALSS